jgi:large subunit ribosomal protein L10
MTSHTRKWKEKEVQELIQLINSYPVIGVCDIQGFPASLFQEIRKKLHGKAVVRVSKTRVAQKAFLESKVKDTALKDYAKNSIALIFTEMNPFELSSFLKKNMGSAPAKTGMIAPQDIVVPAGDTGLPPGPALSDLKGAGINVRIQGATIFVPEDTVVARKGEVISKAVAGTLQKLNIKPIKVGLKLVAALEGSQVFEASLLDINVDKVFNEFKTAHINAFNLAMHVNYFTSETTPLLLSKAFTEAMNLAINVEVLNKDTIEFFLQKANLQALALKSRVPETLKEELKEEGTEEKTEEKPSEKAKEEKESTVENKDSTQKEVKEEKEESH